MANRLIDELIINVRQRGARQAERALRRVRDTVRDTVDDVNELNDAFDRMPEALRASARSASNFEAVLDEINGGIDLLGENTRETNRLLRRLGDTLEGVEEDTVGLSRGMADLGRANNRVQRGLAGTTRQGRGQARTFSDIASAGGSVSLVYASVAANVFALSEGFRLLSEAANVERLERVSGVLGAQLGVPVREVAEQLQEASGSALSFQEALSQASAATAFGFTVDQTTELATVARRASVALGVEFTDALNRVTRGVSRLEPELLDELGVTVRLSEAYEQRARLLNVTTNELSANQRQLAFLNAVLQQSEQRFGQLDPFLQPTYWERAGAAISSTVNQSLQTTASLIENVATSIESNLGGSQLGDQLSQALPTGLLQNFQNVIDFFGNNTAFDQAERRITELQQALQLATTPAARATAIEQIQRELTEVNAQLTTLREAPIPGALERITSGFRDIGAEIQVLNRRSQTLTGLLNRGDMEFGINVENADQIRNAYRDVTGGLEDLQTSIRRVSASFGDSNTIYRTTADQLRIVENALANISGPSRIRALQEVNSALGTENVSALRRTFEVADNTTRAYQNLNREALLLELSGQRDLVINQRKQTVIQEQIAALNNIEGSSATVNQLETQLLTLRVQARDIAIQEAEAIAQAGRERQNQLNMEARARQDAFLGQVGQRSRVGVEGEDLVQQDILTASQNFNSALSQLTAQNPGLESLFNNVNALAASFNNLGETSLNATQLTTVGLNAFSGLLQNVSAQAVAGIDAQIQAERNRDGQSQQSLAKIRALEAQKIREQRRAAQQQILISTAVAVMNAAANPWPVPALPLMASAALAGGLALNQANSASSNQLASLNTSQAQQTASLSVGERDNRVNVQSASSAGELSFIRGETGTGNINSFTPRAAGGIGTPGLGLLVGENGPEFIQPMSDLQITDAEDTREMLQGGDSGSSPIIFNISAVDSQSFMDRAPDIFEAFNNEAQQRGIDLQRIS